MQCAVEKMQCQAVANTSVLAHELQQPGDLGGVRTHIYDNRTVYLRWLPSRHGPESYEYRVRRPLGMEQIHRPSEFRITGPIGVRYNGAFLHMAPPLRGSSMFARRVPCAHHCGGSARMVHGMIAYM